MPSTIDAVSGVIFTPEGETPPLAFAATDLAPISDRQFAQALALAHVITEDEALAWAARGDLPA
ncbi:hypothetical protein [Methylobacterium ajmalii]|uniref:hypothetical protein n=1 Tax=Methylobacterium ajmalii TaxID=2738439 RepID=UPI002F2F8E73